jgi:hypothetical protein
MIERSFLKISSYLFTFEGWVRLGLLVTASNAHHKFTNYYETED